jgi:uroporphyrinogen decarboxylase
MSFIPDYKHIVKAALNIRPTRIPFYEHQISEAIISKVMNCELADPSEYSDSELDEYFGFYCAFFKKMGYDTVSFERILSGIMPGNGALYGHAEGCIKTYEDFEKYPWAELSEIYFKKNKRYFDALERNIPEGMKAIGGVGNGIFECVQDITGYMNLCYIKVDDPDLYEKLFKKTGEVLFDIWTEFIDSYKDLFCVMRMGDDLGFKTNTLLPPEDIIDYIIPGYKNVIDLVHANGRPFLLHSCGNLFDIMENLISAGIDAKHSNEDEIAPMDIWYEKYGDRIGNFGGIDADILCRCKEDDIRAYVTDIYYKSLNAGGVALGSGNSIPSYTPVENYLAMIDVLRELRQS